MTGKVRPAAVQRIPRSVAALLLLLAHAACSDPVAPAADAQDLILFVRDTDIHRMNIDGSDVRNITNLPARYSGLSISPDGRRVTFYSDRVTGCDNIWVMDVDGSSPVQLTGVVAFERCNIWPLWSPDGTKIAFTSSRTPSLGWDAYVINADGSGLVNVSHNPSTETGRNIDMAVGWSPDGRVVIHSNREGVPKTYLAHADGSVIQSFHASDYENPYWSPDGSRILASKLGDGNDRELYVMRSDGTGIVNVSADPAYDHVPTLAYPWSPDGTRIAFASNRTGTSGLYVVNVDGTGLRHLTDDAGWDYFLGWSPDGGKILFSSDRSGHKDIYTINVDGTGLKNLTDHAGDDSNAVWLRRR